MSGSKPKSNQPFVNPQVVYDIQTIEEFSPDKLVDMGVLMHILAKRNWGGKYMGWTECPATWLAENSHMGHRRVRASLDRLTEWGMVKPMSTNGKYVRKSLMYRYDLRRIPSLEQQEAGEDFLKAEVVEENKEAPVKKQEPVVKKEVPVKKQEPVVKHPVKETIHASGNNPEELRAPLMYFDKETFKSVKRYVTYEEFWQQPLCRNCNEFYHSTEGAGSPNAINIYHHQCLGCYVKEVLEKANELGQEVVEVETVFGNKTFTKEEYLTYLAEWRILYRRNNGL